MKLKLTALSIALTLTLSACGQKTPDELVQSANSYMSQNKPSAAVIELKSALQQDPKHIQARIALARVYLTFGDGANAGKEFNRAVDAGASVLELAAERARADYLAGVTPSDQLLQGVAATEHAFAITKLYQAMASFDQGQLQGLDLQFTELSQSSHADVAQIAKAFVAIMQKDVASAEKALVQVDPASFLYTESLMLCARAELVLNDLPKAIKALEQYTQAVPYSNLAKLMLAETYIRNQQGKDAAPIVADLLKKFPEQPIANYLQGILDFDAKEFTKAKEHSEKAIANGLTNVYARVIAAMSNVALKLNAQALAHLRAVKNQLAALPPVQKTYAMLELQDGNPEHAAQILKSQTFSEQDLQLLANAAVELTRQGAGQSAKELLEHVDKNIDKNVQSLASLAMLKMAVGNDLQGGIADLEAAHAQAPDSESTNFTLAIAYLQAKQYDKLAELTNALSKQEKTVSLAHTLDAYAAFEQQQYDKAVASADLAISKDPKNVISYLLKSRIALVQNNKAQALELVQKSLTVNPSYLPALELSFALTQGSPEQATTVDLIKTQINAAPTRSDLRGLLGRILLSEKQVVQLAELIKQDPTPKESRSAELWQLQLTQLELSNDLKGVLAEAQEWRTTQPTAPLAKIALTRAFALNKQYPQALALVKELRASYPDNLKLTGMEILLQAEAGDSKAALAGISALPESYQQQPDTLFMQARLQASQRDFKGAIDSLKKSYQLAKNEPTALALADLLSRNESPKSALKFLENHFSTEPKTPNLQAMYANLLLTLEPAKAEESFLSLLKADEDNLLALNNLAYLYSQEQRFDEAQKLAERAIKINGKHPDVLDTYGVILLKQGKAAQAIDQFKASLSQRPGHPEVLLNLAEAQISHGDKADARKTLELMQNTTANFQQRKTKLMSSL